MGRRAHRNGPRLKDTVSCNLAFLCRFVIWVSGMAEPDPQTQNDLGRRERRKLEMRARIREAGISLCERQGIEATTVQEICRVADVAQKTFFNHFSSKRHLMREIAQASLDQLLLEIETVRKCTGSSREKIQLFFQTIANNAEAAGPTQRELLTEIVHL